MNNPPTGPAQTPASAGTTQSVRSRVPRVHQPGPRAVEAAPPSAPVIAVPASKKPGPPPIPGRPRTPVIPPSAPAIAAPVSKKPPAPPAPVRPRVPVAPPIVPPTPPAPVAVAPESPNGEVRKGRSKFVIISVIGHVAFLLGAWYLVVQTTADRKLTFKGEPAPPSEARKTIDHAVQLAQKRDSMSAPTQPKRVTTTGISKTALPDLALTPDADSPLLSDTQGLGMPGRGAGLGLGALGNSMALGQQTALPFFGVKEAGAGLKGTLYDIKQTATGRPNEFTTAQYGAVLREFIQENWRTAILGKFYKAPHAIYASQIFIPCIPADEAPKAFGVEKEVQPSRWAIHYTGKVTAPITGAFRFVGAADDVLAVRFRGKLVLDGSLSRIAPGWIPTASYTNPLQRNYSVAYRGLSAGDWFQVVEGNSYELEILLGEQPGGGFFAQLMIEQRGVEYPKDPQGNPILPVFRMRDSVLPNAPLSIEHSSNGPVWKIVSKP